MSKHTPGPWDRDKTGKYYEGDVIRHNGVVIAKLVKQATMSADEYEGNAALLTSAPDLLTALSLYQQLNMEQHAGIEISPEAWGECWQAAVAVLSRINSHE